MVFVLPSHSLRKANKIQGLAGVAQHLVMVRFPMHKVLLSCLVYPTILGRAL